LRDTKNFALFDTKNIDYTQLKKRFRQSREEIRYDVFSGKKAATEHQEKFKQQKKELFVYQREYFNKKFKKEFI
jgi:hypothetical protein